VAFVVAARGRFFPGKLFRQEPEKYPRKKPGQGGRDKGAAPASSISLPCGSSLLAQHQWLAYDWFGCHSRFGPSPAFTPRWFVSADEIDFFQKYFCRLMAAKVFFGKRSVGV